MAHVENRQHMQLTQCKFGEQDDAYRVILAVAKDLKEKGKQYWDPDLLTVEGLFRGLNPEEIITGYIGDQVAAATILLFHDPEVWPEVKPGESSFIHKLSVLPQFQGQGIAKQLIDHTDQLTRAKGIQVTRLDCGADRVALCRFYESLGYQRVAQRMIGIYPSMLYQRCV